MTRLLVCPPDYFDVAYEINPWMHLKRRVSQRRSIEQWKALEKIYKKLKVRLEVIRPVKGLPDMVFTANAGLIKGKSFIPSRFRHKERQGEEKQFINWFSRHRYEVKPLPESCVFEGAGDALFLGEKLFAGYHFRSDIHSHSEVGKILDIPVLSLELVDRRFYHLDTCFCPLDGGAAFYYPGAFDSYACKVIIANVPDLIEVNEREAIRFACNAVVIGKNVVMNIGCPKISRALGERGFTVHATDTSEFLKAGGSAKCLTIRL